MNSKKKIVLYIIIFMIIVLVFLMLPFLVIDERRALYINWDINMPKAQKAKSIFYDGIVDREGLEIWEYSDKEISEILNSKEFLNIDDQSREFFIKELNIYYQSLSEDNKKLFDANVNIEALLNKNNYYKYKRKEAEYGSWLLIILEENSKKVYCFTSIY